MYYFTKPQAYQILPTDRGLSFPRDPLVIDFASGSRETQHAAWSTLEAAESSRVRIDTEPSVRQQTRLAHSLAVVGKRIGVLADGVSLLGLLYQHVHENDNSLDARLHLAHKQWRTELVKQYPTAFEVAKEDLAREKFICELLEVAHTAVRGFRQYATTHLLRILHRNHDKIRPTRRTPLRNLQAEISRTLREIERNGLSLKSLRQLHSSTKILRAQLSRFVDPHIQSDRVYACTRESLEKLGDTLTPLMDAVRYRKYDPVYNFLRPLTELLCAVDELVPSKLNDASPRLSQQATILDSALTHSSLCNDGTIKAALNTCYISLQQGNFTPVTQLCRLLAQIYAESLFVGLYGLHGANAPDHQSHRERFQRYRHQTLTGLLALSRSAQVAEECRARAQHASGLISSTLNSYTTAIDTLWDQCSEERDHATVLAMAFWLKPQHAHYFEKIFLTHRDNPLTEE